MDESTNQVLTMEEEGYFSVAEYAKMCHCLPITVIRALNNPNFAEYYARRRQKAAYSNRLWFIKLADVLEHQDKKTLWKGNI